MTTTENQKIILRFLIKNHEPLLGTYMSALTEAFEEGVKVGMEIKNTIELLKKGG